MSLPAAKISPPGQSGRATTAVAAVVIAAAALAAYANTFHVPFVFDDGAAILRNPGIRRLWPLWDACWPQAPGSTVSGRPVANFTLAVNYALSGTGVWSYHAFNLLIHILAGLALFGVVRRTLAASVGAQACCARLHGRFHPDVPRQHRSPHERR